jgi:hypothetical protein
MLGQLMRLIGVFLFGIVKDDAGCVAPARPDPADAVAQVDTVITFRALDRTVMDREGDGVALA